MNTNSLNEQGNHKPETALKENTVELGEYQASYRGRKWTGVLGIGIFLLCDMLCLSVALLPSVKLQGVPLFGFLFTLLVVIGLAAWAIVFYFQTANNSFTLYEQGFKYVDRHGEHQYRWEETEELYYKAVSQFMNGVYTGIEYEFKIIFKDGVEVKIGSNLLGKWHPELEKLGLKILDKTTQMLLPSYDQAFESGEQVDFGPRLVIDKEKLYDRGRWASLSDVKQIEVKQGSVRIATSSNSNWANINVYDIANIMVFLQLAKKFTSVNV
jgi:hypothetical protein